MPRWNVQFKFPFPSLREFGVRWALLPVVVLLLSMSVHGAEPGEEASSNWLPEATNHLGQWIWETNALNKQTVRFWRAFEIPAGAKITNATLRITVDNGYTLYLDGNELGRGSDWRTVTKYDVTQLLAPGRHVLAVEAFNDRLEGGLIFGLHVQFGNGREMEILSDGHWLVVTQPALHWTGLTKSNPAWHPAIVVGKIRQPPWNNWPIGLATTPPLHPVLIHFWQRGWFQLTLLVVCLLALVVCVWLLTQLVAQSAANDVLMVERARIARDIHDDLGAQLTQLVLLGEVAQREARPESAERENFNHICDQARELSHALDEVVWTVNSRRDTLRDFVSYVCKYAQMFLSRTAIRCRLDVEPDLPALAFDLPVRRNLFLAVKEALNNAAKYSQAQELFLRIYRSHQHLTVVVEDNGVGFEVEQAAADRNGLANMAQRMTEIGGGCELASQPGSGCRVMFSVPLNRVSRRGWRFWRRRRGDQANLAAKAGENVWDNANLNPP
jgi:signal transduction histidine kinase